MSSGRVTKSYCPECQGVMHKRAEKWKSAELSGPDLHEVLPTTNRVQLAK